MTLPTLSTKETIFCTVRFRSPPDARTLPQPIQAVRPRLRHLPSLTQMSCSVVYAAPWVPYRVSQLVLNEVRLEAQDFTQQGNVMVSRRISSARNNSHGYCTCLLIRLSPTTEDGQAGWHKACGSAPPAHDWLQVPTDSRKFDSAWVCGQ